MAKGVGVFVLYSLGETMATSLIENMYIKKLCFVNNVMGNKSAIKDGEGNGYVCNVPEDYAERIREAIKDPPYEFLEREHQDEMNNYNTGIMKKKYIHFYGKLAGGDPENSIIYIRHGTVSGYMYIRFLPGKVVAA